MKRVTFFEWVEALGQAEIVRLLGPPFHAVRVHRAAHAKHKVDEGLIGRCEEVLGEGFDRGRTLDEWYRRRREAEQKAAEGAGGAP